MLPRTVERCRFQKLGSELAGVNYSERPASIILSGAVEHVH